MNGKEFPGLHEALVTADLWERANAAIQPALLPAARRFRARDKHFHVLKGVAHCGCCGRAMIPNASGKLDPDGKPYRYYTCGYAHKERSDAKCPVRHVSANALETAVIGFLSACSQHSDVLAATVASARERRQVDRAPLRARLTEAERALDAVTAQLRNCAKLPVLGNVTSLDEVLREQAETLQAEKQRLLVEREQVRLELAECERGEIDSDRIREALSKLGELLPSFTRQEQRDLIMLFLERVEVRLGDKPANNLAPGTRLLELRMKLHVGRLVEGMAGRLVIEERTARAASAAPSRPLVLTLNVAPAPTSGSAKPVTLLTPFRCELGMTRRAPAPQPAAAPVQHPIHRARAWQRRLESEPALNRLKLAAEAGLSPGSITHHKKLLQLAAEIPTQLMNLTSVEEVRRYGLNQMKALAELPADEQLRQFAIIADTSPSNAELPFSVTLLSIDVRFSDRDKCRHGLESKGLAPQPRGVSRVHGAAGRGAWPERTAGGRRALCAGVADARRKKIGGAVGRAARRRQSEVAAVHRRQPVG